MFVSLPIARMLLLSNLLASIFALIASKRLTNNWKNMTNFTSRRSPLYGMGLFCGDFLTYEVLADFVGFFGVSVFGIPVFSHLSRGFNHE